ncbi:MAG: hypothetical protein ACOYNZ_01355 [Rhodoferax sp.]
MAWLTLASAALVQPVGAADDLQSSQLVDQARHWQKKNRDDIAADYWRKILLIDPKYPEALVKLGMIELRAGNLGEAEALYLRASQLSSRPGGLKELAAAIDVAKGGTAKLAPQTAPPPVQKKQPEPMLSASPAKAPAPAPAPAQAQVPAPAAAKPAAVSPVPKASAVPATPAATTTDSSKARPEPITKANPAKTLAPAAAKPTAVPPAPKASAVPATPAATAIDSSKPSASPATIEEPRLIFSTSLDLVPEKPGQ